MHTPTPWYQIKPEQSNGFVYVYKESPDIGEVCTCYCGDQEANAAFIVQACNSHDALVEACKAALELVKRDVTDEGRTLTGEWMAEVYAKLRAALSAAEAGDNG
jgi:hypothetical protein